MSIFSRVTNFISNNRYELGYGLLDTVVSTELGQMQRGIQTTIDVSIKSIQDPQFKIKIQNTDLDSIDKLISKIWNKAVNNSKKNLLQARFGDVLVTTAKCLPTLAYGLTASTVTGFFGPLPVTIVVLTPVIGKLINLGITAISPTSRVGEHLDVAIEFAYDYVKLSIVVMRQLSGVSSIEEAGRYILPFAIEFTAAKIANVLFLRKASETGVLPFIVFPSLLMGVERNIIDDKGTFVLAATSLFLQPVLENIRYHEIHKDRVVGAFSRRINQLNALYLPTKISIAKNVIKKDLEKKLQKLHDIDSDDLDAMDEVKKVLGEVKAYKKDKFDDHFNGAKKGVKDLGKSEKEAVKRKKEIEARQWIQEIVDNRIEDPKAQNRRHEDVVWLLNRLEDLSKKLKNSSKQDIKSSIKKTLKEAPLHLNNRTEDWLLETTVKVLVDQ